IDNAENLRVLDDVRVEYLGKKGRITDLLKGLANLSGEERPRAGASINQAKQLIQEKLDSKKTFLAETEQAQKLSAHQLDVTLPGRGSKLGSLHPVTQTMQRIESFFNTLGFVVVEGPEVEDDYHNFEALNIPAH